MLKMKELLLKICGKEINLREEISSIEMVLLMNELNEISGKKISIFELIETENLIDISELYGINFK